MKANSPKTADPSRPPSSIHWSLKFLLLILVLVLANGLLCKFTLENRKDDHDRGVRAAHARIVVGKLCPAAGACESAVLYVAPIEREPLEQLGPILEARKPSWICFISEGGQTELGTKFQQYVRNQKIGTCIVPEQTKNGVAEEIFCNSACAWIWMSGTKRILAGGGPVARFHASYAGKGACCALPNIISRVTHPETMPDEEKSPDYAARQYLREQANRFGPDDGYRLTGEEAVKLGLVPPGSDQAGWHFVSDN